MGLEDLATAGMFARILRSEINVIAYLVRVPLYRILFQVPVMVRRRTPATIWVAIAVGCLLFSLALIVSARFEPAIRVLHTLQTLIYLALVIRTRREDPWGFGAGFSIAVFWNYANIAVTGFIQSGWAELVEWLKTGELQRPDLLISLVAATGHFLLIAACLIAFLHSTRASADWLRYCAGGVLAIGCFCLMILAAGPQYIDVLETVFGL